MDATLKRPKTRLYVDRRLRRNEIARIGGSRAAIERRLPTDERLFHIQFQSVEFSSRIIFS